MLSYNHLFFSETKQYIIIPKLDQRSNYPTIYRVLRHLNHTIKYQVKRPLHHRGSHNRRSRSRSPVDRHVRNSDYYRGIKSEYKDIEEHRYRNNQEDVMRNNPRRNDDDVEEVSRTERSVSL